MNVLVAEDDFLSRKLLTTTLEQMGYSVFAAEDGEEAWRMFQTTPFRLVVSDWLMPRMDGLELCEKIREHGEADYTYFVLVTANVAEKSNYDLAMSRGVDDFLSKPIDRHELGIRLAVAQRILKATSKIRSLENVLTICAYTKKVMFPEEGWQTVEEFMRRHLGITVSHGISPDYYEKVIKPEIEKLKTAVPSDSASADEHPSQ